MVYLSNESSNANSESSFASCRVTDLKIFLFEKYF